MAITFKDRRSAYPGRFKATLEDGSSYYVTLERADEPSVAGTPLNAATFNAVMRELRGYADVRNLLDNSDFTNPVNQRGADHYGGGAKYTIDRWKSASMLGVTVEDGWITLECSSGAEARNGFVQCFAEEKTPTPGTMITVAYEDENGNIYVNSAEMPESGSVSVGSTVNVYGPDSGAKVAVMVSPGEMIGLKWIAVYEGEYTKADLPKYRPKDHAAELMECMRYYQVRSTNDVAAVDMRPLMRSSSPTVTAVTGGYGYSADL